MLNPRKIKGNRFEGELRDWFLDWAMKQNAPAVPMAEAWAARQRSTSSFGTPHPSESKPNAERPFRRISGLAPPKSLSLLIRV